MYFVDAIFTESDDALLEDMLTLQEADNGAPRISDDAQDQPISNNAGL